MTERKDNTMKSREHVTRIEYQIDRGISLGVRGIVHLAMRCELRDFCLGFKNGARMLVRGR
jgi:hypothetical protein